MCKNSGNVIIIENLLINWEWIRILNYLVFVFKIRCIMGIKFIDLYENFFVDFVVGIGWVKILLDVKMNCFCEDL